MNENSSLKLTDIPTELLDIVFGNLLLVNPEPSDLHSGEIKEFDHLYPLHSITEFDQQVLHAGMLRFNENLLQKSRMGTLYPAILSVNKSLYAAGRPSFTSNAMFAIATPIALHEICKLCNPPITSWNV